MNQSEPQRIGEILNRSKFVFPYRWWKMMARLMPDEKQTLCHAVLNYIFEGRSPEIMSVGASEIWAVIAQDIDSKTKHRLREASHRNLEKEAIKEQDPPLSQLSPVEKEILQEKDAAARAFDKTMQSRYPNVYAMKMPLTHDDFLRLLKLWPIDMVRQTLANMNRYARIMEYVDAYRTCIKWMQMERKRIEADGRWYLYESKVAEQQKAIARYLPFIRSHNAKL